MGYNYWYKRIAHLMYTYIYIHMYNIFGLSRFWCEKNKTPYLLITIYIVNTCVVLGWLSNGLAGYLLV